MQAIVTKYLPATNFRGARIKAECERGKVTIPFPHELTWNLAHISAADLLVARFVNEDAKRHPDSTFLNPWASPRVCGSISHDKCAHVFLHKY